MKLESKVIKLLEQDPIFTGKFYYPGSKEYEEDIYHWSASSTKRSYCTIRPQTNEDVSKILKLIGEYRENFAVKSGGHIANPGFSSSYNFTISMKNFNKVVYHRDSKTVVVGTGQVWDNIYKALEKENPPRCILGARVSNIGVAGFILGGGYSWQANQYGLAIDSVVEYELVKPDGSVVKASPTLNSDLYFALRGGGNNFGIITQVTLKTFIQGTVWGGKAFLVAGHLREEVLHKLFLASQNFVNIQEKYPKAAIILSLGVLPSKSSRVINLILFYDGEMYPDGIFDEFREIVGKVKAAGWKTRNFSDLISSAMPYGASKDFRGILNTVPVSHYGTDFLEAIWNETKVLPNDHKTPNNLYQINYSVEPFTSSILSHSKFKSAYPYDRRSALSPFALYVSWKQEDEKDDKIMEEFMRYATTRVRQEVSRLGISTGAMYPNYALFDTKLEEIYGNNMTELKRIKKNVDPTNVMGLAGGFKF